jgi:glycosyltransferase involved in cell wall biosynthesis
MVKEADALADAGYQVTVLYVYWNKWGTEFDKVLIASKKWKAICVGGDPQYKRITYFISRTIYKLTKTITRNAKAALAADIKAARASYFLTQAAKKHSADLYIAHNIGALPAVVAAAKANNKPCGFDAEDLHRYEVHDDNDHEDVALKTTIENRYIPQLNYLTTSSPQIADTYKKLFKGLKPIVLLNVFPKSSLHFNAEASNVIRPLKLFWFSQTIGPNRGISDVINALRLISELHLVDSNAFELHLLGDMPPKSDSFIKEINSYGIHVTFHKPIHPDNIISFASQFDIGLALENKEPYNRNVCLTNKIFVYMQAGLAIIASDTIAQKEFMDSNPTIGKVYRKEALETMAAIFFNFYKDPKLLAACKSESLRLGHDRYNWETESVKFLALVEKTLFDNVGK